MKSSLLSLRAFTVVLVLAASGGSFAAAPVVTEALLAPLESAYLRAVIPSEEAELHRGLFGTVLERVHRMHAQEVDVTRLTNAALKTLEPLAPQSGEPAEVFAKAINAALATLDPYSRYLDAHAARDHRSAISGSFGGLGLQVEMVDGVVRIVAPIPGTPAARAGLRSGDLIVGFDERPAQGMTLQEAISAMRGAPGSSIALMIRRGIEENTFTVPLVREVIRRDPLRWSLEGDVLVLRLANFTRGVAATMEKAIAEVTADTAPRAVVLDLRGNGGGLFRQAVMTADVFLREGEIVSIEDRADGRRRSWTANTTEHLEGLPMVVLIDGRTASASELVAAALQENGRAIVMGQRSFGKGSVQSMISLGEGKGALRLTTALYRGPSGRSVQRTGVGPDIEIVPAKQATGSTPRRREADRAHALPGTEEPPPPSVRVEESQCGPPAPSADPVLACALVFIDAGGIESFLATVDVAKQSSTQ